MVTCFKIGMFSKNLKNGKVENFSLIWAQAKIVYGEDSLFYSFSLATVEEPNDVAIQIIYWWIWLLPLLVFWFYWYLWRYVIIQTPSDEREREENPSTLEQVHFIINKTILWIILTLIVYFVTGYLTKQNVETRA